MAGKKALSGEDKLLALARKIVKRDGIGLVDAMIEAEERLKPKATIQTEFVVTLRLKPRIASWVLRDFSGHPKFSIEERLAAVCVRFLNSESVLAIRAGSSPARLKSGGGDNNAVTMLRGELAAQEPGA